jgi:hypothetical protein
MLNVSRLSCVLSVLFCLLAALAGPTAKAQSPALLHQLDRVDFSVNGIGQFNGSGSGIPKSGPVDQHGNPLTVHLSTGNTLGALVTVRYIKSPLVGVEGNYSYARYTETFTPFGSPTTGGLPSAGVQTNASEYTLGYVAHTPKLLTVQPFVSAGAGTIAFRPTTYGGQSLREQARAAYYYSIGAEDAISPHFGLRAQFRQVFFLAPDFGQNYLTILHHTSTLEPGVGFYFRF